MNRLLIPFFFLLAISAVSGLATPAMAQDPDPDVLYIYDVEPKIQNQKHLIKAIGFPPKALKKNISGKVMIRVLMDEEGNYLRHIVLENPHKILTKAVESKIHMVRFSPATIQGKPAKCWVTIPFDFKMNK